MLYGWRLRRYDFKIEIQSVCMFDKKCEQSQYKSLSYDVLHVNKRVVVDTETSMS